MRDLQPTGREINFDGVDRKFLFTLNVIDELQEKFDKPIVDIINMMLGESKEEKMKSFDVLAEIVTSLANEDVEIYNENADVKRELINKKYIKRKLTLNNYSYVASIVIQAFSDGLPKVDEEKN